MAVAQLLALLYDHLCQQVIERYSVIFSYYPHLSGPGTEGGLHGHVAHPGQVPLAQPVEGLVPGLGPVQEGVQHHEGAGREVFLESYSCQRNFAEVFKNTENAALCLP